MNTTNNRSSPEQVRPNLIYANEYNIQIFQNFHTQEHYKYVLKGSFRNKVIITVTMAMCGAGCSESRDLHNHARGFIPVIITTKLSSIIIRLRTKRQRLCTSRSIIVYRLPYYPYFRIYKVYYSAGTRQQGTLLKDFQRRGALCVRGRWNAHSLVIDDCCLVQYIGHIS